MQAAWERIDKTDPRFNTFIGSPWGFEMEDIKYASLVWVEYGQPVAYMVLNQGDIEVFEVHPDHRSRGRGSAIIAELRELWKGDICLADGATFKSERAKNFWEKNKIPYRYDAIRRQG